ncbi:MAG: ferredoxin [bacterium]|nr:ferredoxin [bacterium]
MIVSVTDECVCCGACEAINPEVFSVDSTARVNSDMVQGFEQDCIDAALICPVNAIRIDDIF